MAPKFRLLTRTTNSGETKDVLTSYYSNWRNINSAMNAPFVALYSSFKDKHLATLDPGPLRLYLYFSFHANNTTGHSWHSIQTIAKFFKTQTRTIDNWIKVLVDNDLIYRERADKLSNTTFLIPYSNTILQQRPTKKFEADSQDLLENLIALIRKRKELYGEIVGVFHLFQWKVKKGLPVTSDATQLLLILTKRKNEILIGHIYVLKRCSDLGISEMDVEDLVSFISPFEYNNSPVQGIGLNHSTPIHIKKNAKELLNLCEQLVQAEDTDFDLLPQVEYGPILELLGEIIEDEDGEKNND